MVALAGDLRPTERTPVRLPLSLTKVPAGMPLSSITGQHSDWPTIVEFSACQPRGYRITPAECTDPNGTLSIKIWPKDDSFESTDDDQFPSWTDGAIATAIGGTDGLYNAASSEAGVQIRPEMVATFEIADPDGGPRPTTNSAGHSRHRPIADGSRERRDLAACRGLGETSDRSERAKG